MTPYNSTVTHRDNCPVSDEPLWSEGVRVSPVLGVAVEGVEVHLHEAASGQGPLPHLHNDPSVPQPVFTITEKAPTRAFSWFKVPTSAFTFKTLTIKTLC